AQVMPIDKVQRFVRLLLLHPHNAENAIQNFSRRINNADLQNMESSFLTMFPVKIFKKQVILVHRKLYDYTINYHLYDLLKANDEKFTTEFGYRLERYVGLGLDEIGVVYKTENQLKKILKQSPNQVDFWLPDDNIFIEVKATELQAYP